VTRGSSQVSDTWQADLDIWAYGWTYPEVTRVTTVRVTRGTDDVSSLRVDDMAVQKMTCQEGK
jgi:hypothetical protein